MNDKPQDSQVTLIECPPASDPAVRCFIFAGMLFGMSVYCYVTRVGPPPAWELKYINPILEYLMSWAPLVCVPAGLVAAVLGIRHLATKLVADDQGLRFGGTEVAWSDVTVLDASQLAGKGILNLECGADRVVTLKSWKFKNFKQLAAFIEKKLPSSVQRRGVGE